MGCFANGGSVTVPSGVPFTVYGGWGALRIGQVIDWLHGSTNTLSVGYGAPIDMTPYFAGLSSDWTPGGWSDIFFYQVRCKVSSVVRSDRSTQSVAAKAGP